MRRKNLREVKNNKESKEDGHKEVFVDGAPARFMWRGRPTSFLNGEVNKYRAPALPRWRVRAVE
ncbi:hypothetical protein PIB30_027288 [Stylosanthes scabra]|uniref:Uncharacterized protein n=1 Tax=Stylosanthes scabra TaxID=79078 RepID=A0ABU6Y9K6_9FABA|nr:hypothetical protein [Stylosanthes scabra]